MAQRQGSTAVADAPDTLPADFFDKKQASGGTAPDTLPADFFDKNEQDKPGAFREELPGATPRLMAATGGKATKPRTDFELNTGKGISTEGLGSEFLDKLKGMASGAAEALNPLNMFRYKPILPAIAQEVSHEYKRSRGAGSPPLAAAGSAAVAGAGPLAGVSNLEQEQLAERGEGGKILGGSLAPAAAAALPLAHDIPAVRRIGDVAAEATKGIPGKTALALRTEQGPLKPLVHKVSGALSGAGGAMVGGALGVPEAGAILGYGLGPSIAEKLIPKLPTDIPVKPGTTSGILPSIDEFYSTRAEDLAKRGKEQTALDRTAQREQVAKAKAEKAAAPKIIDPTKEVAPGEARRVGNEGRPATWTNEFVLQKAASGDRGGITQAVLRGLPLPENARYIMGDPDTARAILNPREVTRFTPEGEPIRNSENPFTQEPTSRVPIISRNPRPIPQLSPVTPRPGILPFPGAMPEEPAAAVVGGRPQAPERPVASAATGPTLLEPIPPMGIKPLQGVKPVLPGVEETPRTEVKPTEPIPKEEPKPEAAAEPEPEEVKIKGLTAEEPKAKGEKKIKPIPVEKRYSMDEILNAEGLLASESGAMLSGDKPGVYFDAIGQTDAPNLKENFKTGTRHGGQWRGVTSGRDMYPFMRENPDLAPSAVQKALRNKDSAAYSKLMDKAVDFIRREDAKGAQDFLSSIENPDAEPENVEPGAEEFAPPPEETPQAPAIPPAEIAQRGGILPGMEQAVAEQNAGAAKVSAENLTNELNTPKGDITQAAGRMETLSPLFRGTEASPQREIFGKIPNAPAPASTVPPVIDAALKDSGWEYEGRNSFGLYTIKEPGTNIRITLMERELNPDFIRRKIAEKEKQYGVPQERKPAKEGEGNIEQDLSAAAKELNEATKAYREKKIGDDEYIAARRKHADLLAKWEAARGEAPPTGAKLKKFLKD
jgi:hypothetical protein